MMSVLQSLSGIMPVTSVLYLAFLAVVVAVFYALRNTTARAAWLLLASLTFYALMSPRDLLVLVGLTAVAYIAGLSLDRPAGRRRLIAGASVSLVVAVLAFFKYGAAFASLLAKVPATADLMRTSPALAIAMPVGISFWSFQLIAYLVDVYRGDAQPVRDPLRMLLSVVFFPIVTIGPITHVENLTEQFGRLRRFDYDRMRSALLLMAWGFFKKLLIADRLAVFVGSVYGNVHGQGGGLRHGPIYLVATVFFALQLYADFSGYTDIVRGSARLMGIDLPENFAAPYLATSVAEFWRRWHMTLMDWLKRYVYIPLGGNRKGPVRKRVNQLAVFLVSGLWHGVGLTFVVWGLLNGLYMIVGEMTAPLRERLLRFLGVDPSSGVHRVFRILVTFLLVTVAWTFFRAQSISDALFMLPRMFVPGPWILSDGSLLTHGLTSAELAIAALATGMMFLVDYLRFERGIDVSGWLAEQHIGFRWLVYYGLIFVIAVFGYYGGSGTDAASFLYFKF